MKNRLLALVATLMMVACAPPIETKSTRLTAASSVELINAPENARLIAGEVEADAKEGVARIDVADGWHDVVVMIGNRTISRRRVFVQDGSTKVIDFNEPR